MIAPPPSPYFNFALVEMKVLTQVPVNLFIHVSALVITVTIFLCYGIAVALGHVKAWLPMISDCAVLPPEKYPFRYVFSRVKESHCVVYTRTKWLSSYLCGELRLMRRPR